MKESHFSFDYAPAVEDDDRTITTTAALRIALPNFRLLYQIHV